MIETPLRVLHFCYSGHPQPGILRQLESEYHHSKGEVVNWEISYFTHTSDHDLQPFVYVTGLKNNRVGFINRLFCYLYLRCYALFWLMRRRSQWDVILIRYMAGDPFLFLFCLVSKRYITVHHTKEEDEINSSKGGGRYLRLLVERIFGKLILRKSMGRIAVTNEILKYEQIRSGVVKPDFLFPNGITVNLKTELTDDRKGKVKLVFVGSRSYAWNGLDYIDEELANSNRQDFELHIVGDIAPFISDERVIYHGVLCHEKLALLYQRMDLGLGTFGLHRKNMKEACTLKSRDYLSNGLAVVADHVDSALPESFPFYTQHKFKLDIIVNIALKNRVHSKQEVRLAASQFINKRSWIVALMYWLVDLVDISKNKNKPS